MNSQITPTDVQAWLATNPSNISKQERQEMKDQVIDRKLVDVRSKCIQIIESGGKGEERSREIIGQLQEFAETRAAKQADAYVEDLIMARDQLSIKDLLQIADGNPDLILVAEQKMVEEQEKEPDKLIYTEYLLHIIALKLRLLMPGAGVQATMFLQQHLEMFLEQYNASGNERTQANIARCLELAGGVGKFEELWRRLHLQSSTLQSLQTTTPQFPQKQNFLNAIKNVRLYPGKGEEIKNLLNHQKHIPKKSSLQKQKLNDLSALQSLHSTPNLRDVLSATCNEFLGIVGDRGNPDMRSADTRRYLLGARFGRHREAGQREDAEQYLQIAWIKKYKEEVMDSSRSSRGEMYRQIILQKLAKWVQLPGAPMPTLEELGFHYNWCGLMKFMGVSEEDIRQHQEQPADQRNQVVKKWKEAMQGFLQTPKRLQAFAIWRKHNRVESTFELENIKEICTAMEELPPRQAENVSYLLGVMASDEKAAGVQLFIGLIAAVPDAIEPMKALVETITLTGKTTMKRGSSHFQQVAFLKVFSPLAHKCIENPALGAALIASADDMGTLKDGGTDHERMRTYYHEVERRTAELTFALGIPAVKSFLLSASGRENEHHLLNQHTKNILFLAAYLDESLLLQYVQLAKLHPLLCAKGIGLFSKATLGYFNKVTTNQVNNNLNEVRERSRTQAKGHVAVLNCIEKLGNAAKPFIQHLEEIGGVEVQGSMNNIPEVLEKHELQGLIYAMQDEKFVIFWKGHMAELLRQEEEETQEEKISRQPTVPPRVALMMAIGSHKSKRSIEAHKALTLYAAAPEAEAMQEPTLATCLEKYPQQMKAFVKMLEEEKISKPLPAGIFAYIRDLIVDGVPIEEIENNYFPMTFAYSPNLLMQEPSWKRMVQDPKTAEQAKSLSMGHRGRYEYREKPNKEQYEYIRDHLNLVTPEMAKSLEMLVIDIPFTSLSGEISIAQLLVSHPYGVNCIQENIKLLPDERRPGGKGMFLLDSKPPFISHQDVTACKRLVIGISEDKIREVIEAYLHFQKSPDIQQFEELVSFPKIEKILVSCSIVWENFEKLYELYMDREREDITLLINTCCQTAYRQELLEALKENPNALQELCNIASYLSQQEFFAFTQKLKSTGSSYPIITPEQVAILSLPFLKGKTATREELVSRTNAGLQADYLLTLHQVHAEPALPYEMIASAQSPSKELKAKMEALGLEWKKVSQKKGAADSISAYCTYIPTNIGEPPIFEKGSRKVKGGPVRGKTKKAFENIVKRAQHDGLEMLKLLSKTWNHLSAEDVELIEDMCETYGTNALENVKSYIELLKKNFPGDWNEVRYVGEEMVYWKKVATDKDVSEALKALIDDSRDNLYVVDKLSHIGEYYGERAKEKVIEYAQKYLKEGSSVMKKWNREMQEYMCENIRDFCNLDKNPNKIGFRTLDPKVFERYSKLGSEREREAFKLNVLETQIQLVVSNDFRKPKDMDGETFQFVLNELIQASKFSFGSRDHIQNMIDEFSQLPPQAVEGALPPQKVEVQAAAAESMEANKNVEALQELADPICSMVSQKPSTEEYEATYALLKENIMQELREAQQDSTSPEVLEAVVRALEKENGKGGKESLIFYILLIKSELPEEVRTVLAQKRVMMRVLRLIKLKNTNSAHVADVNVGQKRYGRESLDKLQNFYMHLDSGVQQVASAADELKRVYDILKQEGIIPDGILQASSTITKFEIDKEAECRVFTQQEMNILQSELTHQTDAAKKSGTDQTKTLHFMLANGLLDQFAGVIGNACYFSLGLLTKEKFPYLVGHIRIVENYRKPLNGKKDEVMAEIQETKNMPAIRGGCLLFRSTLAVADQDRDPGLQEKEESVPIPAFILRADNPQDKLLNEIDAADYLQKMNAYAKEQARVILQKEGYNGPFLVVRPNEERSNATATNRARLHAPMKAEIYKQGNVQLSESIPFNSQAGGSWYNLQDLCAIVEEGWVGEEKKGQKAKITLIPNRDKKGGGGYSWVA